MVTNWGKDPYSGMAYSYIPIGSTGEEYDHMACDIDDKLFFAGEVCIKYLVSVLEIFAYNSTCHVVEVTVEVIWNIVIYSIAIDFLIVIRLQW